MVVFITILSLIEMVIMGFLCKKMRESKGYYGGFWVGFFFNLLALIYFAGLPDLNLHTKIDRLLKTDISKPTAYQTSNFVANHIGRCDKCNTTIENYPCPHCGFTPK